MRCEKCGGTCLIVIDSCYKNNVIIHCDDCDGMGITEWNALQHIGNRIDRRAREDLLCSESPRQKQIYKCKEGPFTSCAECKQTAKEWLDDTP